MKHPQAKPSYLTNVLIHSLLLLTRLAGVSLATDSTCFTVHVVRKMTPLLCEVCG